MAAAFKFPPLDISVPIVGPDGRPSAQFQVFWQQLGKQVEAQEAGQNDLIGQLQEAQDDIADLVEQLGAQITYLGELTTWLAALGDYTLERVAYLQICVGVLATETGTVLPDPDPPLPDYPGPPPDPPPPPPGP